MGDELVTMRERIGMAANASALNPDLTAGISHTDVLGGMGAATHMRVFDEQLKRMVAKVTECGTAQVNPRRRLAALLQEAKFGMDRKATRPAVLLFAQALRQQRDYRTWRVKGADALVFRLAGVLVTEWLYDRCPQCGDAGRVPSGKAARNNSTVLCQVCKGRPRKPDAAGRAQALGVSMEVYDKHWVRRFEDGGKLLRDIEASNIGPLRAQTRHDTLPVTSG